ncbi:Squalene epoxidase [Dimargaris cristalligena]|uniref:Squalene monooxygenase n=1 Tax=Dimargaris cristalligena TaxID=215637 RepID=A0A4Q0A2P6_9FUNG|nr:Squalene epoxidase [Dimargaris cristalligena]RKP39801.1 squalene epoxidase-domain-containing protein [Dimargaris cristalligena]|eukprot:RKP39801.1 squalene epoxidase-domain-containing protein [Dimargaris cristalligena]
MVNTTTTTSTTEPATVALSPCEHDANISYCDNPPSCEYDVIIIGAGVAGAALAYAFGTDSRKVLLVERDLSEPDRIVGELMQPGGIQALQKLGLEDCIENIEGITTRGYVVCQKGSIVNLKYPVNPATGKPFVGKSFHHGRFVSNLRKACDNVKGVTIVQGSVNTLIEVPLLDRVVGITYTPTDATTTSTAFAPITVVADGGASKFRKSYLDKEPVGRSQFYGFIIKDCPLIAPNNGHVILSKIAPVLMYQIDPNETRVLVDVPNDARQNFPGDIKSYIREQVLPDIPESLQAKFSESLETERLRSMPNRFLPSSMNTQDGLIYVGDSLNMRHPLTGGGMTVALWDVVHLRNLLSKDTVESFYDTHLVLAQLSSFHWVRKSRASAINILAQALYALFSAEDDPDLKVLRQACFDYFQLGGTCITTPMGLLGGVFTSPLLLMYHFFAVVLYGMLCFLLSSAGPVAFVCNLGRAASVLWMGCKVFLPLLWTELVS